MPISALSENLPESFAIVFTDANTPGPLTLTDSDKTLRRVDQLIATNNDTADHVIRLRLAFGGNYYWLGSATVPAGAGFGGAIGVDLMVLAEPTSLPGIALGGFTTIECYCEDAIGSGKGLWVTSFGGIF